MNNKAGTQFDPFFQIQTLVGGSDIVMTFTSRKVLHLSTFPITESKFPVLGGFRFLHSSQWYPDTIPLAVLPMFLIDTTVSHATDDFVCNRTKRILFAK